MTKEGKQKNYYLIGAILFFVAVALVIVGWWWLSRGQVTKEGQNPDPVTSDSVSCFSEEVEYPFISTQPSETSHSLKVDLVFSGEKLNVIGLYYELEFETEEDASNAIQVLTPELNLSMDKAKVDNKFVSNTQFAKNDNHVTLKLYTDASGITTDNAKYVLIDENDVADKDKLVNHFEGQGLDCKAKTDNQIVENS